MGWECRCGRSAVAEERTVSSLSAGPETLVIDTEKCTELMRMRKDDVISQNENEKDLNENVSKRTIILAENEHSEAGEK